MNKLVLGLAIASTLGLSACDDETIKDVEKEVVDNGTAVTPTARVKFDPSAGAAGLSIPNDLIFSGTQDGTLEIPVADPTDGSDPFVAISALDGWSISQPFSLAIEFPTGTSLDATSVDPSAVRIFEAIMGGDANDSDCTAVTRGLACKIVGELTFGQDFVTQASGNSVSVIPTKPLKAETSYIMVMTNSLRDNNGKAVAGSTTYELARQDVETLPLGNASQLALQGTINSYEKVLVAAGIDSNTIIYSAAMTTQSTTRVLSTIKSIMAKISVPQMVASAQKGIPAIGIRDTDKSVADILGSAIPPSLVPLYSSANYFRGSVNLPYYSAVPTAENALAPVNKWWRARCDSGAMLKALSVQNPSAIKPGPLDENDGFCMQFGLRDLSSYLALDTERNLTKFNPIPTTTKVLPIDVQMTTPDLAVANTIRASMSLPALEEPVDGWPVAMLVHGITSTKEQMLPITGLLSLHGIATIAIDQPLHGSRGFDLNGDGIDDINTSTVSTLHYVNLASMLTMRDNTRQSTADLLGLRLGINFLGGVDADGKPIKVDKSKVHLLGHSLGGIYGMNTVGLANTALDPKVDGLFNIASTSLAMPGLMLANFGIDSPAFEGLAKSNLTLNLSPEFKALVTANLPKNYKQSELSSLFFTFYNALPVADKAKLDAGFAQFTFAAQTVTDSGDPVAYVQTLAATNTPTHLIEVVGNGVDNLSDQTVTNTAPFTPMGGTEPAIALLGLQAVSEDTNGSGAVRFVNGHHSSILDPRPNAASPDPELSGRATQEMQTQVATFFASMGQLIKVTDAAVVKQ